MLKTNSKQLREKVRAYIMETFTDYEEKGAEGRTEAEVFAYIAEGIAKEKISFDKAKRPERFQKFYKGNLYNVFEDYAQGLGGLFDTDYFVKPCVDFVGDMLEQTIQERAKYTEQQAENLFTLLLFRELEKYLHDAIY